MSCPDLGLEVALGLRPVHGCPLLAALKEPPTGEVVGLRISVNWADVARWLIGLSERASKLVTILEGSDEMWGVYCPLAECLELMYHVRAVPA